MAAKKPAAKKCVCAKGGCKAASKPFEKAPPLKRGLPCVNVQKNREPIPTRSGEIDGGPMEYDPASRTIFYDGKPALKLGDPEPVKTVDGNVLKGVADSPFGYETLSQAKSTEGYFGGGTAPAAAAPEPDPAPKKDPLDDPEAYINHAVGLDDAKRATASEPFYDKARRLSREARFRAAETESAIKRIIDEQIQSAAEIELKLNDSNLRISQAIYDLTLILPAGTPKGDKARLAAVQLAIRAQDDDWAEELYHEFAVHPMALPAKAELELLKVQIDTIGVNYKLYWQTEEFVKP